MADDAFVSNASKIKSSLSPLGLSFLLIHEPLESHKGRRWTATGETRTKFKAEGGLRFSGIELDSKTANIDNGASKGNIEGCSPDDTSQNGTEITSLLTDLLNAVEKMLNEKRNVADLVSGIPSNEKSPSEAAAEPSNIINNGAKSSSKIPLGLTRLPSLVEDIRCREGGDTFLFVEDPEPNRNFWFGTGKLRQMALAGEVGFQSEANDGNEESIIPNGDVQREAGDAEADEEVPNESSERNENLLGRESKEKSDSERRNYNSTDADSESRNESDDDSDIEIIHTVDARPYSSSGSSSPDDEDSVSRSPSSQETRPSTKEDRRHSGSKDQKSCPVYANCEDDDDNHIATANLQKRKASSDDKDESEPADKRRPTTSCDNKEVGKVGPKVFRVDDKLPGPKIQRVGAWGNMSDGSAKEKRRGEGEISEIVEDSKEKDEDNKNQDYEKDDKGVEEDLDKDDDAASSDGSDIEVIGTVSPPPRSRSSSSSSRSRSRSRSPRGSRSPSPLFTRDFLYSGAPRISLEDGDYDDDDDDIEDLTTTDADDKLYDEEMGTADDGVETEGKDVGDEIVDDAAPLPPPKKGGSIECIEVDDED